MPNPSPQPESQYIQDSPSTTASTPTVKPDDAAPQIDRVDEAKYGTGKPRRVVIRARIAHGSNQENKK